MKTQTVVIFRKYKDGTIIALFPYDVQNYLGHVLSYEHIGQHSDADYLGVINDTKLATENEYKGLLSELMMIGYDNLIVKKRMSYKQYLEGKNEFLGEMRSLGA